MTTANRVLKNTGFLYAKMGITMFISLYTTRLILNALGASDFGIFNIVGGAIAMLGFLNAAMAGATQRFMSYSEGAGIKENQKKIFNISFTLHFAIAIIMAVVLLIAGYFFFNGILNIAPDRIYAAKVVYASLIVSTIFTVMTVPYEAVLNAHENMLYYSIVGIVESLLKLGAALAIVQAAGDKLVLYGILMAGIPLVTMTIMRIYCHKNYIECIIAPRKYWDKAMIKEMTSFAGWNFIGSAVSMISGYGQGIILNHFFGTLLNAAQGIANQISGQLMAFISNLQKSINPIIGKSAGANDFLLFKKTIFTGTKISFILYYILVIPFIIEAPYVLELWLKSIPEWTVIFFQLQLFQKYIAVSFTVLPQAIMAMGNIKNYTIFTSIPNVLQLPIIYLLFYYNYPPYFLYIVGITLGNIIPATISLIYVKKYCRISIVEYLKKIIVPTSSAAIISIIILLVYTIYYPINTIFSFIVFLIISFCISFFLSYYLISNKEEREIISTLFQKIIVKIKRE